MLILEKLQKLHNSLYFNKKAPNFLGAFLIWAAWTFSGWALSRFAPIEAQLYTGSIQYVLIGLVIVTMLLWRPQGLFPERLVVSQSGLR